MRKRFSQLSKCCQAHIETIYAQGILFIVECPTCKAELRRLRKGQKTVEEYPHTPKEKE